MLPSNSPKVTEKISNTIDGGEGRGSSPVRTKIAITRQDVVNASNGRRLRTFDAAGVAFGASFSASFAPSFVVFLEYRLMKRNNCRAGRCACVAPLIFGILGMRESGYSLSPLYLKPVLIVGKFGRVCVCVCVSAGISNVSIFTKFLDIYVKL